MKDAELNTLVLEILWDSAPETNFDALDPNRPLRDQLDMDSMDFLNFLIALDEKLHT